MIEKLPGQNNIQIHGQDYRQQLVVSGIRANGSKLDMTGEVKYETQPKGIIDVDSRGYITPLKDGKSRLVVHGPRNLQTAIEVTVSGISKPAPINFKNQIVPLFTKMGCNSGGCHGKSTGQNGFRLSLLGFYPHEDYEYLVKEDRGRRLFPAAPQHSLLMRKATGKIPHGGGKRMKVDSYEYRLLYRWISQGMPYGSEKDPSVASIRCIPEKRVMGLSSNQQVSVIATYSDGTTEDVTRMALFEANDTEMAETSKTGVVTTHNLTGEVAVMARYQGQVAAFRATIPLKNVVKNMPAANNFVDEAVFGKLKELNIPPSKLCDDPTFVRRVYLDITGTLPTAEESAKFVKETYPQKRERLIDTLLESSEYADYFANKWNMVLRNKKRAAGDLAGTFAFQRWIYNSIYENKPYDKFVREILTAAGDSNVNPASVWYREVDQINEQVEDTAQLFLGLRIQCARCHHHPFEKWSQNDYYGMAAFFSRLGKKNLSRGQRVGRDRRVVHNTGVASARNPKNGKILKPTGLGSQPFVIPPDRDPRVYLANWLTAKENPFFAKALVNRYWKHFFSRGIVEPEDDMRATNPPSNPELLDKLADHFVKTDYDFKELIRAICQSKTYQLSALPNELNIKDKQNFSRYYPKRLSAEVLYDAFHQVTGTGQNYSRMPQGTRAVQLVDTTTVPYFLKVFGQPKADTACECERSGEANLAQSLHLLNSSEVQQKISSNTGRAFKLSVEKKRTHEERIKELYRWFYSREPDAREMKIALAQIAKNAKNPRPAYEDIVWALVNTKEFLFNH